MAQSRRSIFSKRRRESNNKLEGILTNTLCFYMFRCCPKNCPMKIQQHDQQGKYQPAGDRLRNAEFPEKTDGIIDALTDIIVQRCLESPREKHRVAKYRYRVPYDSKAKRTPLKSTLLVNCTQPGIPCRKWIILNATSVAPIPSDDLLLMLVTDPSQPQVATNAGNQRSKQHPHFCDDN